MRLTGCSGLGPSSVPPQQPRVVAFVLELQAIDQHRVGSLHVVEQRGAGLDVLPERVPGPGLAGLAEWRLCANDT